ncbi:MAG: ABC transporter permease [Firmicutes bacterium]|jgi:osmoprotectant transport system permease protein|nr:ABC transporter permease [Bacillota bacterium]
MTYLVENWPEVINLAAEHLRITAFAMAIAVAIGVPLGILIARIRPLGPVVLAVASIFYLIPSLALFAVLVPVTGLGPQPAVIGLVLYSQLAIVRNTATGLLTVPPSLRETAEGMGMTGLQRLFLVELPLALPMIIAGIRVAAVMSIGAATIAAYVGAGGLGTLIFQGMRLLWPEMVLAGAIPASVMAVAVDFAFVLLERLAARHQRATLPLRRRAAAA